jgi:hypothetical protein
MSLDHLLRELIASGRLAEPFTAVQAARAVNLDEWPLAKVQNFLARHCIGNLAASVLLVERVAYGRYRLIYDGPRDALYDVAAADAGPFGLRPGSPGWPDNSQS